MKNKKNLSGFSFIFVLLLLFSACKKEEEADTIPPAQVSDLAAFAADEEVVLTWTEPTDPDLHQIEVTFSPGSGVALWQTAGLNGITVPGLTNETEYTFSVVTVDETGNKSQAATVSAIPNTPFVVVDPDRNSYNPAGGPTYSSDGSGHLIISVTYVAVKHPRVTLRCILLLLIGDS